MPEIWLPIPEIPGYEASTEGNIQSVDRVIQTKRGPQRHKGCVLKPAPGSDGKLYVIVSGQRCRRVHLLVLRTFRGPCPPGLEGCHNDGNELNNRLENLRWDTRSSNILDQVRHGTHRWSGHDECPHGHKLTEDNIIWHGPDKRWRRCRKCNRK
jgi:HNH endonuclease/NUMOD4 motif-containing protein